jgi:hypothetical protein
MPIVSKSELPVWFSLIPGSVQVTAANPDPIVVLVMSRCSRRPPPSGSGRGLRFAELYGDHRHAPGQDCCSGWSAKEANRPNRGPLIAARVSARARAFFRYRNVA